MYAIVDDGVVVNVVMWDGDAASWQPPQGAQAILVTDETGLAYIGSPYADGHFSAPPVPQ